MNLKNMNILLSPSKFDSSTPHPLSTTSIDSSPYSRTFTSIFVAPASIAFSTSSFTAIAKLKTTYTNINSISTETLRKCMQNPKHPNDTKKQHKQKNTLFHFHEFLIVFFFVYLTRTNAVNSILIYRRNCFGRFSCWRFFGRAHFLLCWMCLDCFVCFQSSASPIWMRSCSSVVLFESFIGLK